MSGLMPRVLRDGSFETVQLFLANLEGLVTKPEVANRPFTFFQANLTYQPGFHGIRPYGRPIFGRSIDIRNFYDPPNIRIGRD
ncbi:hypothetical protein [uncultured Roseibium sp.]|uniref:hypothetical protein n=1 Tax=uncultured Roseibium sp. TaxID=1936171 RepID=UPI003216D99F